MSFFELLVIAVVGLIVIGPDKLPEALRTGMLWMGRIKRMVNDTKQEFEQQLGVDEIRRELHNEQILESLKAIEDAKQDITESLDPAEQALKKQIKEIEDSIDDPVPHDEPTSDETLSNETGNSEASVLAKDLPPHASSSETEK